MKTIQLKDFTIGSKGHSPLAVMTGPCVLEDEAHALLSVERLLRIFEGRSARLIFKASYDKANRSSIQSFRGPGLKEGLRILGRIQEEFGLPVVTDVHTPEEAQRAGEQIDILQIPAFLCRQTDLLVAAAQTGRILNVKKGQFMAPWEMGNVVDKIRSAGNEQIILCDRGSSFGYNNLVSDFRSIPVMAGYGVPVCFDASHSVQLPGGQGAQSGGQREFIPVLARAALAAGADCLFVESHPDPSSAKSDAATVWPMDRLPQLLDQVECIYEAMASPCFDGALSLAD